MTELEKRCLKQNATELRKIAKSMSNLQNTTNRYIAQNQVDCLQDRLMEIVDTMHSLKIVIAQPLKNGTNQ